MSTFFWNWEKDFYLRRGKNALALTMIILYVDLVFYNPLLRCYVIIDLKRGKFTHQDLGQMQMYVNYFDRYVKQDDEKPSMGILLCHSKKDELVELTLAKDTNIHAREYQLYLPTKEELRKQMVEAQKDWEEHHA